MTSSTSKRNDSGTVSSKCFGGFQINDQFEFGRSFNRQVSRLFSSQNLLHKQRHLPVQGAALVANRPDRRHINNRRDFNKSSLTQL
jgi:hypothetical protein